MDDTHVREFIGKLDQIILLISNFPEYFMNKIGQGPDIVRRYLNYNTSTYLKFPVNF